jgi:hypothetical protein
MVSSDYAEGMTAGYAQGAAATAESIRNKLARLVGDNQSLAMGIDVAYLVDEITKDYGLEPY